MAKATKANWRNRPLARAALANAAMFEAGSRGDVEALRRSVSEGAELVATRDDRTVLHIACELGNPEVALAALDLGAPIDSTGPATPVSSAAAAGHRELVAALADRGADLELAPEYQETALEAAASNGHLDIVTDLLQRGASPGRGLVRAKTVDVVSALLEAGTDVDAADSYGTRAIDCASDRDIVRALMAAGAKPVDPLRCAARCGDVELVKQALESGGTASEEEDSVLSIAIKSDRLEAVRVLVDLATKPELDTALLEACGSWGRDPVEAVEVLVDAGADPDATDGYSSALLVAASYGAIETVKLLLARGANPAKVTDDRTPLTECSSDHPEIAVLLIEAGASLPKKFVVNAAEMGSIELVERAIANGDKIDAVDDHGDTALIKACVAGSDDAVRWLIEAGAKITKKDSDGATPLERAAGAGNSSTVELLLEAGAKVGSAHVAAAETEHPDIALRLLEAGGKADARNDSSRTILHTAAMAGHSKVIAAALDSGAPVDKQDIIEHTALAYAASRGHYDCCQLLLAAGASPRARTYVGETPLSEAIERGCVAVTMLLLANGAQVTAELGTKALVAAAGAGSLPVVEALVAAGAKPADERDSGAWPVEAAARRSHLAVVEYLLERGASVSRGDDPPLVAAAEGGHRAVVDLLLDRGAPVDADRFLLAAAEGGDVDVLRIAAAGVGDIDGPLDYFKRTALLKAASAGRAAAVSFLIDAGASLDATDEDGKTAFALTYSAEVRQLLSSSGARVESAALIEGARAGQYAAVGELLATQINLDSRDELGRTALMEAVANGHNDVALALIAAGADVNATDEDNWTALMEAAEYGDLDASSALLDAGAAPFIKDCWGFIAFAIAKKAGHRRLTKLLKERGADVDRAEELADAVRDGKTKKVEKLLATEISFDTGELMYTAASRGSLAIVKLLADAGAAVDVKDSYGDTALHAAAGSDHHRVVSELVDRGASVSTVNDEGETPLVCAIEHGAKKSVAVLLQAAEPSAELLDALLRAEMMAAAESVAGGGVAVDVSTYEGCALANKLLKKGSTPTFRDVQAGLEFVVEANELTVLQALLATGEADLAKRDEAGATIAMLAARQGHKKLLAALAEADAPMTGCIATAAGWGELTRPLTKLLIEAGDVVDGVDDGGHTALMHAAKDGELTLAKALVKAGGDIDRRTEDGQTALGLAIEAGHDDVVSWLLDKNPSLDGRDGSGWTPLMHAAKSGDLKLVKDLVDRGAGTFGCLLGGAASGKLSVLKHCLKIDGDLEQADGDNWTAAMHAAESGSGKALELLFDRGAQADGTLLAASANGKLAIAKLCIERGASSTWCGENGQTPLMRAAEDDNKKMVELVLECGADLDAQDEDGWTALMYAANADSADCVGALIEAGADRGLTDSDGKTAYDRVDDDEYAMYRDSSEAIKDLVRP